jgi:hypothetical protein
MRLIEYRVKLKAKNLLWWGVERMAGRPLRGRSVKRITPTRIRRSN